METETTQTEIPNQPAIQEADNRLNKSVGNLEIVKLEAKDVVCQKVNLVPKTKKDSDVKVGDIAEIVCKHPDREEIVNFTKAIHVVKKNIKEAGLWYGEDKEGNIQKGSALANVLSFYKASSLGSLVGMTLKTEANDAGFLAIKAY